MSENIIEIRSLAKKFGVFTAVDSISLDIAEGEMFSLLVMGSYLFRKSAA